MSPCRELISPKALPKVCSRGLLKVRPDLIYLRILPNRLPGRMSSLFHPVVAAPFLVSLLQKGNYHPSMPLQKFCMSMCQPRHPYKIPTFKILGGSRPSRAVPVQNCLLAALTSTPMTSQPTFKNSSFLFLYILYIYIFISLVGTSQTPAQAWALSPLER